MSFRTGYEGDRIFNIYSLTDEIVGYMNNCGEKASYIAGAIEIEVKLPIFENFRNRLLAKSQDPSRLNHNFYRGAMESAQFSVKSPNFYPKNVIA